jgi:hypothetical protein
MSEELEEELKKYNEVLKASINRTELAKWIEAGEPYEEHEEVLLFLNQNERTYSGSVGKSLIYIILYFCIYLINKLEIINS